jgi:hypothetical protein
VLLDRRHLRLHAPWVILGLAITFALTAWFIQASWRAERWVGGGSEVGLVAGIAAASTIVFEMLLLPRKWLRRLRLIPAKYWMAAHLWLGTFCLPWAIIHCGGHLGGWLPTIFMIVLALTFLSGIYGVLLQQVLPRWMLRHLPAETIYSQIDHVAEQTVTDLRRQLVATCGPDPNETHRDRSRGEHAVGELNDDDEPASHRSSAPRTVVIGALRQHGRVRGRVVKTLVSKDASADRQPLWNAMHQLEPFLRDGRSSQSPLAEPRRADEWLSRLRTACTKGAAPILEAMEQAHRQRQQFEIQQTMHRWLHAWIPIHLGLSLGVLILLVAHIVVAMRYW